MSEVVTVKEYKERIATLEQRFDAVLEISETLQTQLAAEKIRTTDLLAACEYVRQFLNRETEGILRKRLDAAIAKVAT